MRRGERPDETRLSEEVSQEGRAATRESSELGPAAGRPDIFPGPLSATTGRHFDCRSHGYHDPPSARDAVVPPENAADMVLDNGNVVTADPAASIAQPMAIKDGPMLAAGRTDPSGTLTRSKARLALSMRGRSEI